MFYSADKLFQKRFRDVEVARITEPLGDKFSLLSANNTQIVTNPSLLCLERTLRKVVVDHRHLLFSARLQSIFSARNLAS